MRRILFFIFCCCSLAAISQSRISADRPDQTEGATLTPPHYFQAELGFGKINYSTRDYAITYPQMLFKYGISKPFELQLLTTLVYSYQQMIPNPFIAKGFTPLTFGCRTAICEEKKILPKTSIIIRLGVPKLASAYFKTDYVVVTCLLPMEKSLTKHVGLSSNVGIAWDGFASTPLFIYTFSSGYDLGKKMDAFVEVFGSTKFQPFSQFNIDAGLGYYLSNNAKLDLSGGFGITESSPKNFFAIGFSFRVH